MVLKVRFLLSSLIQGMENLMEGVVSPSPAVSLLSVNRSSLKDLRFPTGGRQDLWEDVAIFMNIRPPPPPPPPPGDPAPRDEGGRFTSQPPPRGGPNHPPPSVKR